MIINDNQYLSKFEANQDQPESMPAFQESYLSHLSHLLQLLRLLQLHHFYKGHCSSTGLLRLTMRAIPGCSHAGSSLIGRLLRTFPIKPSMPCGACLPPLRKKEQGHEQRERDTCDAVQSIPRMGSPQL